MATHLKNLFTDGYKGLPAATKGVEPQTMDHFDSDEVNLNQLRIRMQNLKILLEEAVLRGNNARMSQLLADIEKVEGEIARQTEHENDHT